MAFDGITVASIVHELNKYLIGGRIYKIAQPEKDELLLTVKNEGNSYRLMVSANASLPLIYLTEENKVSPAVAPAFTMLLRKHIQNGRIISISQPGLERIIVFEFEHLDEMGDVCRKRLVVELMGKYSNIIFTDDKDVILDSIKRVNAMTSSVREVLPGLKYFVPMQEGKMNPLETDRQSFEEVVAAHPEDPAKAIYMSYVGISPMIAGEIAYDESSAYEAFAEVMRRVKDGDYEPQTLYENGTVRDFSMVPVCSYAEENRHRYDSPSELLIAFYREKEVTTRSRQKSADLRKIAQTILERDVKKYDLQLKQLKDTEKMEKYRVYGELLHTYGYAATPGDKSITVNNYYTGEDITIPLDEQLSAMDNAKKYFDRYGKLKRTKEALETLTIEVKEEIDHLESILSALDFAVKEEDLNEIKEEMTECGYIRRKATKGAKQRFKSKPYHYVSSDGFHIYVGKNNYQNEELTFKFANGGDWWFHAKGIPGSHVVVKCEGAELPDRTFEEAARLAAHYSKGNGSDKVEVDYLRRKDVKKPNGSKPGFVVYYTNYSMVIDTSIEGLSEVSE